MQTLWCEELGGGRTRLHAQSLVDSFEVRDAWLLSRMGVGTNQGDAKLDALFGERWWTPLPTTAWCASGRGERDGLR